jgi:GDPmannose 4,6-dehydratase
MASRTVYISATSTPSVTGVTRDYIDGMWRILQHSEPEDFVLATGEKHTVRELIDAAFAVVGRELQWRGKGTDEVGLDAASGRVVVCIDPRYFRPTEVDLLLGDSSKARAKLGWTHTTSFKDLIAEMVRSDLKVVLEERDRRDRHG